MSESENGEPARGLAESGAERGAATTEQTSGAPPPDRANGAASAAKPRIGDTRPAPRPTPVAGSTPASRSAPEPGPTPGPDPAPDPAPGTTLAAGDESDAEPLTAAPGSRRAGRSRRRGGRDRRTKSVGRYLVCVHVQPHVTQISVLEGRSLVEHYVARAADDTNQIDGNVYLGRVQNVLPGMEAAFVDIGTPKNAVLYWGDVRYDRDDVEGGSAPAKPRIEDVLRPGQMILCQVTKNPIGAKGPGSPRRSRSPAASPSSSPTVRPSASPSAWPTTSVAACARSSTRSARAATGSSSEPPQ